MKTRIFYSEKLSLENLLTADEYESHYLIKVMRAEKGEQIELFSSKNYADAVFVNEKNKLAVLEILKIHDFVNIFPKISIMQCFPEHTKSELAVQKLTELGADEIIFLESENSIKISPNKKIKLEKILREAVRQSRRYSMPIIKFGNLKEILNISFYIENQSSYKIIILDKSGKTLKEINEYKQFKNIIVIVGPEQGFSKNELETFKTSGFDIININHNILRTETAVISIMSIFSLLKNN